jgi:hypothetical protein
VTQCKHTGLKNGVTYYYRVSAAGDNGKSSSLSEEKSGVPISSAIYPPNNFKVIPGDGEDTLSWDQSAGTDRYTIYWDTSAGVTEQSNAIDGITSLLYIHSGITNGKTYYYRIGVKDAAGGVSALSNEISAIPVNPVAAPQNLTAIPGNGFITLNIDKYGGSKKVSFRIYWALTSGVNTASDTVLSKWGKGIQLPHTVTGLTNGTTYFYRASTIEAGKESELSNEASATPSDTIPIDPPQNVKATKGNAQVNLSWGAAVNAVKYTIFWATDPGVTEQSSTIPVTGKPFYTHTGLANFTTYYYRINAEDTDGITSVLSDEISATPDTNVSDLAPKNVVAAAGSGEIAIAWDPVSGAGGYIIYWDTKPGVSEKSNYIKEKGMKSPYTHKGLISGVTYYYKVGAWLKKGVYLSREVSSTPHK